MENTPAADGSVAAPGPIASGALQSNRIIPCGPALRGPAAGGTTTAIHKDEAGEIRETHTRTSKCSPHVFEAMRLLESFGYKPVRLTESEVPLNIVGFRGQEPLFVLVISARRPIDRAATLRRMYEPQVLSACAHAGMTKARIMIWVHSPRCGWRYYKVHPGGLEYDWKFPYSL